MVMIDSLVELGFRCPTCRSGLVKSFSGFFCRRCKEVVRFEEVGFYG